jgi:protein involved in polysaccharide export with SLBB domain
VLYHLAEHKPVAARVVTNPAVFTLKLRLQGATLGVLVVSLSVVLTTLLFGQSSGPKPDGLAYYLAPNDKITIRAPQVEKLNGKTFQISPDGLVLLPSVGRLQAGGLTPQALEKQIAKRLRQNSSGEPKVTVSVVGVPSQQKTPI